VLLRQRDRLSSHTGAHKRNSGGWRRDGRATQAPMRCQSATGEREVKEGESGPGWH
jgi:hypothetical protein